MGMLYADYSFYLDEYKGRDIPNETEFNHLVIEASAYIDYITHGNMEGVELPDAVMRKVRFATCAIADICLAESKDSGVIASESVGNHSRSYANANVGSEKRENQKYKKAVLFLRGSGLLYGGMR